MLFCKTGFQKSVSVQRTHTLANSHIVNLHRVVIHRGKGPTKPHIRYTRVKMVFL